MAGNRGKVRALLKRGAEAGVGGGAEFVGRGWGSRTEKSPTVEKALVPQNEYLHSLVLSLILFGTISKSPHHIGLLSTFADWG